jgi:hypothetical protein
MGYLTMFIIIIGFIALFSFDLFKIHDICSKECNCKNFNFHDKNKKKLPSLVYLPLKN